MRRQEGRLDRHGPAGTTSTVAETNGGVVAGTPQEKTQRQALDYAGAAQGDGSNLLVQAESTGKEIKADAG